MILTRFYPACYYNSPHCTHLANVRLPKIHQQTCSNCLVYGYLGNDEKAEQFIISSFSKFRYAVACLIQYLAHKYLMPKGWE